MNLRQIQELIKFVAKSGATEVDLEIGDVKLSIKSPPKGKIQNTEQPITPTQIIPLQQPVIQAPISSQPISQTQQPVPPSSVNNSETTENISINSDVENSNYVTIKAPIIGTFYR